MTAEGRPVANKDTTTSSINGSQTGIAVNPSTATHLAVSGYPSPTTAGTLHGFTVTALDAYGNIATGYTGTVTFSSSDPQATLRANYTFTTSNNGVRTFTSTGITL